MNPRGVNRYRTESLSLLALAAVFFARAVVQLVQRFAAIEFLPEFSSWQSGAVPYPALFGSQLLILIAMAWVIYRVQTNSFEIRTRTSNILGILGVVYFISMIVRMVVGITIRAGHPWWDAPLPTWFHLGLASFVVLTAFAGRGSK